MYQESKDLQTQVNSLSEELRLIKMELSALCRHLKLNINPKREVVAFEVREYLSNPVGGSTVGGMVMDTLAKK